MNSKRQCSWQHSKYYKLTSLVYKWPQVLYLYRQNTKTRLLAELDSITQMHNLILKFTTSHQQYFIYFELYYMGCKVRSLVQVRIQDDWRISIKYFHGGEKLETKGNRDNSFAKEHTKQYLNNLHVRLLINISSTDIQSVKN